MTLDNKSSDNDTSLLMTDEISVINGKDYKGKHPAVTLKLLKTIIPDNFMRTYILSFIRTKLTTLNHSPVVLYFVGDEGTGKTVLFNMLNKICGEKGMCSLSSKQFIGQYNNWVLGKYFVQLEEYWNTLYEESDRQRFIGKIKSYSGSPELQIRAMRQDGFNYRHNITLILSGNTEYMSLGSENRRIAFIETPNKLDKQMWIYILGGFDAVMTAIDSERLDFCRYLFTEVKNLDPYDYENVPQDI